VPRSEFAAFRLPPDVAVLAVCCWLRFGLSYRDVEELLAEQGVDVTAGGRASLVRRRDVREGVRPLAVRVPGGDRAGLGLSIALGHTGLSLLYAILFLVGCAGIAFENASTAAARRPCPGRSADGGAARRRQLSTAQPPPHHHAGRGRGRRESHFPRPRGQYR
jgi:hypothetical protein